MSSFLRRVLRHSLTTAALLTATVSSVHAQIISQGGSISPLYGFGQTGAQAVGQTFVAAGPAITSFTFWLSNEASLGTGENTPGASSLSFSAYLAKWNGTGIEGGLMYSSAEVGGVSEPSQAFSFSFAPLAVETGATYIAFLSVPTASLDLASAAIESGDEALVGGQAFVGQPSINEWQDLGGLQLRFAASFNQRATVPEPNSLPLVLSGAFVLSLFAARRGLRRR